MTATNEDAAQEAWERAEEANFEFHLAAMLGDQEGAEQQRLKGITACIELADLIRGGAEFFTNDPPEVREEFLSDYPAGSTAQELVDAHFSEGH